MVRGLDQFKKHFANFSENYVLIGGVACTLVAEDQGFNFRATKDFDVVLCIEALNRKFVETFWAFIKEGRYECRQRSSGKKLFYRFHSPADPIYPVMLELFSKKPDALFIKNNSHLTPIPIDEEISSLSAILLNDEYYQFIQEGKREIDELPILAPTHLIPLKVRAWIDLSAQRDLGAHIDASNISKHRNDVIRLSQLLSDVQVASPFLVKQDMQMFLEKIAKVPFDLKPFGITGKNFEEVVSLLRHIYGLQPSSAKR